MRHSYSVNHIIIHKYKYKYKYSKLYVRKETKEKNAMHGFEIAKNHASSFSRKCQNKYVRKEILYYSFL